MTTRVRAKRDIVLRGCSDYCELVPEGTEGTIVYDPDDGDDVQIWGVEWDAYLYSEVRGEEPEHCGAGTTVIEVRADVCEPLD